MSLQPPVSDKMQCMEVWGGNRATWSQFSVPGLDLWVYSQPFRSSEGGGDVYYLSSCASGRITRLLLSDVSGHGATVAPIAVALRDLMRQNINFIDQTRLVVALNSQFESISACGLFATALVCTYFSPTRTLSVCNAGHPLPLFHSKSAGRWQPCVGEADVATQQNLPIGIIDDGTYRSSRMKLQVNDMLMAYTDSLSEAVGTDGRLLGAEGICRLLNSMPLLSPELLIPALVDKLRELHPGNLTTDDTSVMLLRANGTGVTFLETLKAPFRLLREAFRTGQEIES